MESHAAELPSKLRPLWFSWPASRQNGTARFQPLVKRANLFGAEQIRADKALAPVTWVTLLELWRLKQQLLYCYGAVCPFPPNAVTQLQLSNFTVWVLEELAGRRLHESGRQWLSWLVLISVSNWPLLAKRDNRDINKWSGGGCRQ